MLSDGTLSCSYDSANRLVSAGGHTYTYNAEDVRIRSLCQCEDTLYTYDTNCKLSRLLCKTTDGVTTKYVYGRGLIGEETGTAFKTYHFDSRGSTVAITDASGNVTDTFAYDTYGKQIARTGTSDVIFGYNGRDGVVTDDNGLVYMRARYYSPAMRRFINADIIAGKLSNAVTLNRFAYANGNPVSFVDPFGLSSERGGSTDETLPNFYTAVLVSNFDKDAGGLPVFGHTMLYFYGDDDIWYLTQFAPPENVSGVKNKKSAAQISWGRLLYTPDFYDRTTGKFKKDVQGISYVVLHGNFNESAKLAKKYSENQRFGRYNFFFHNCSDYTDEILRVAEIDNEISQERCNGKVLLSIPAASVYWLSTAEKLDSLEPLKSLYSTYSSALLGATAMGEAGLAHMGEFGDSALNFIEDVSNTANDIREDFADGVKMFFLATTNAMAIVGTSMKDEVVDAWNRLFGE